MRVKGQEPPDLPVGVFLTASEESADMSVTHEFVAGECFKRDEDMEGNHYAWYTVTEYGRTIDKTPGVKAEIERLEAEKTVLEDTICELDSSTDERITNAEDSICELDILVDELMNGGN